MNYKDIFNPRDVDLEVVILSCGKYYRLLVLHTSHGKWADRPKWQCKSNKNYCNINTVGDTPKDAVLEFYHRLKQSNLIK